MPNSTLVWRGLVPVPFFYRLLLLGLSLAVPKAAQCQQQAAVRGTVTTNTGQAVEAATVTLHRAADSVAVKTEFSDGQGAFRLEAPSGARYLLSTTQVGYAHAWGPVFELPAAGVTLPAIALLPNAASVLKEVTVTARKPQFERLADRTVVNVADGPLSAGTTALDVLSRSPGVTVEANDNLRLRGRQGLLVVINGKRSPLTGAELADYLRALPADQLQSIELITNPPARYDAQGGAGVIAINLRKDERLGTNGSANASYGRSEYGKFTGGLGLNHRRQNLNIYGNYAYADRWYFTRIDFSRQFAATPLLPAAASEQANNQVSHLHSHTGKVGADFTLSKRTLLGVSGTGLTSQIDNNITNATSVLGEVSRPSYRFFGLTAQDINRPSGSVNLNLRHAFADSATAAAITADADYARYQTTRLLNQYTYEENPSRPNSLLSGNQYSRLTISAVKVDYSMPLPHRFVLETGAKLTKVTTDNNVSFLTNGAYNPLISSNFQYNENVNAAYVDVHGALSKTTLQVGLRAEHTNTLAESSAEYSRKQNYVQLFPSATVQRTLSQQHTLSLTAARRIDRPNYIQVNPLRSYVDATSYRTGNIDLVAQTSYNVELTHTYRQKFIASLAYARTNLPILNVVQPSPDGNRIVMSQDRNLTKQFYYALTLTAPVALAKWWKLYANGILYYNRVQGNVAGTELDRGQGAYNLTVNSSFALPHDWSADLNGLYESREKFAFESISSRGQLSAGLQKTFLSKQGTLRLNVTDFLYTTPVSSTATYDNFTESFYRRLDTRIVTAAFTYRFGNGKVAAARKRAAGADDELRRTNGL